MPKFVFNQTLEKAEVPGEAEAGDSLFAPNHGFDYMWTVPQLLTTDGVCAFVYFWFLFSFNNQTIVYICSLARSHKEEYPNKEKKSHTGKGGGARKENPDTLPFVPMEGRILSSLWGKGDREGEGPSGIL